MKTVYEIRQHDTCLANPVYLADTFFSRFRGLMFRKSLRDGEGLLLNNCDSIHCFFMRFTIDVIYLDKNMTVIAVETVKPWHIGSFFKGAKHVLELAEGKGKDFRINEPIETIKGVYKA